MVEVLNKLFGKNGRVLVKDGEFNNVKGNYHHYDSSQRITNHGCYNVIGNNLDNISNSYAQVIHHGGGPHSMHRSATHRVATVNVSTRNNHASTQPNNAIALRPHPQASLSRGFPFPQNAGQNVYTQCGDMRPMTSGEHSFMQHSMSQMKQEIKSEFGDDDEEQEPDDDTSEDEMSPHLSGDFHRLTIGERVSASPRSALIQGPSLNTGQANESPRYTIIQGNHVEVDDRVYQHDFNSHFVGNNIIENSFGQGNTEGLAQITQFRNFGQNFIPRRQ